MVKELPLPHGVPRLQHRAPLPDLRGSSCGKKSFRNKPTAFRDLLAPTGTDRIRKVTPGLS